MRCSAELTQVLYDASKKGDLKMMRYAMNRGASVNFLDAVRGHESHKPQDKRIPVVFNAQSRRVIAFAVVQHPTPRCCWRRARPRREASASSGSHPHRRQ